jgi:hypothetical protein
MARVAQPVAVYAAPDQMEVQRNLRVDELSARSCHGPMLTARRLESTGEDL